MSEIKLQSDIVKRFSEIYPEKRGQLFHVPNERNSRLQAFKAKAIGIFPGVSDLIFIDINNIGISKMIAIELKEPNSRHEVNQILVQLEWAEIATSLGVVWRLCRSIEEAISCTEHIYKGLTIKDVRTMLENNGNKKTIKF